MPSTRHPRNHVRAIINVEGYILVMDFEPGLVATARMLEGGEP
jgi:hypothetical protein